jgi:hypothetical protein
MRAIVSAGDTTSTVARSGAAAITQMMASSLAMGRDFIELRQARDV